MTGRVGAVDLARRLGLVHDPTPEQVAIIEAPLEPLLVIAGAGSGKTETMAARVVWLVATGQVRAEEVLGLTFTRKAAGELSDRIGARLRRLGGRPGGKLGDDGPRISTYNAYAGSLVADHGLSIGVDPDARLLTEAGRWQLAAHVVETWLGDLALESAPSTVTRAVLDLAGALAEHLRAPGDVAGDLEALAASLLDRGSTDRRDGPRRPVRDAAASLRARAQLMDLVEEFARRKRDRGLVDFSDQVALACRLAGEVPDVRAGERARYRVVLLDEYQDTSVAQVALLSRLFGEGHPVTAVGDPHQAIYGWRGASSGAVARFPALFPRVGPDGTRQPARTETLATSWRNDRAVLSVANTLAGPLRAGRPTVEGLAGPELPVLRPRPSAGPGTVSAFYAETAEEEATTLARVLAGLWRAREPGSARPTAAVLCRARSQMPAIAQALRAAGLPVEVVGLGGLLSTPEVRDIHAALLVAHDPSRADAAMRLLTGLRLGIADLDVLNDHARLLAGRPPDADRVDGADAPSIVEALDHPPAPGWTARAGRPMSAVGLARVRGLGSALRAIRSLTHLPLPELVTTVERVLGLDIEVLARPGADPRHDRRHLDAFTEAAADFARGAQEPTLGAFLAWLDAAAEYERGLDTPDVEPDPAAVQVLTVHAAKGLEWDVVAVPGMAEGAFPAHDGAADPGATPRASAWLTSVRSLPFPLRGDSGDLPALDIDGSADHGSMAHEVEAFRGRCGAHALSEERRLAYVAVTRARSALVLSGSWWKEGVKQCRPPSRFLAELGRAGGLGGGFDAEAWRAPASAANPLAEGRRAARWPAPRDDDRRERAQRAGDAVRRAAARLVDDAVPAFGQSAVASRWWADAERLIAEDAERRRPTLDVALPAHLAASAVVRLVADPGAFAMDRRRPVPREPTARARRGSRFHAWVERHYRLAPLIDPEDLPGAEDADGAPDLEFERLREAFLASPWAARRPIAVEVDLETPVAGTMIRCRVDAVFGTDDGVEIVDWKTGPPQGDAVVARQMQLALYRMAWARLHAMPLDAVSARFVHVAEGTEVVALPMDEAAISATVSAYVAAPGAVPGQP